MLTQVEAIIVICHQQQVWAYRIQNNQKLQPWTIQPPLKAHDQPPSLMAMVSHGLWSASSSSITVIDYQASSQTITIAVTTIVI
jgi:hypothetical protein